jgi:hypothetical protein
MARMEPERHLMGATEEVVADLGPVLGDVLRNLLLLKSLFVGTWFLNLGTRGDGTEAETFANIGQQTVDEGFAATSNLEQWAALHVAPEQLERLAHDVRFTLIEAIILMKEASTEAFLQAAMAAPSEALRQDLVTLADMDRRHADELRLVIGGRPLSDRRTREREAETRQAYGAHDGRFQPGTLSRSVQAAIDRVRREGNEPMRLALSPSALRHLRDEGAIDQYIAFDLPVDVELGEGGEVFAVATRERNSLAEVVSADGAEAAARAGPGSRDAQP